jgi:hypothetical protein
MVKDLKTILASVIKQEHTWKLRLFKEWDEIIGTMGSVVTIEKIDDTTLFLAVSHPAWAQELQALAPALLVKINAVLKDHQLLQIKCAYRSRHAPKLLHRQVIRRHAYLPPQPLSWQEERLLATIPDAALQSAFAAYLVRCKTIQRRA